jgi:hypothetical protein
MMLLLRPHAAPPPQAIALIVMDRGRVLSNPGHPAFYVLRCSSGTLFFGEMRL